MQEQQKEYLGRIIHRVRSETNISISNDTLIIHDYFTIKKMWYRNIWENSTSKRVR